MKQLLSSLVAVCSLAPAFAQKKTFCDLPDAARKGGMLYYGSLGGFTGNSGNARIANAFINSGLGYLVTDHLTLGVQAGFSHYRVREKGYGVFRNSGYEAGIFGRYTAYLSPAIFIFGQADAGYINDFSGPKTGDGLGLNIHPGAGVFIGRNWALNVNADIFSLRSGNGGTTAVFNLGQGYHFGVSKNFGGRHKTATTTTH